jgi:phage baseplate assembly protein W
MADQDPRRTFIRRTLGWGAAAPLIEPGDVGRDLVLVPRDGSGRLDLACVEGADNLGQDLAVALTTGLGADPFNADFGFDGLAALVEEQEPALVRERLRASVAKTVARDPRVRSVTAIEVDQGSASVTRTLSLRVAVDTIASDTASLITRLT